MIMGNRALTDPLLNEIERILKRQRKGVVDLAAELGRNYHQVYNWLRVRRFAPGLGGYNQLRDWRDAAVAGLRRKKKARAKAYGKQTNK